MWLLRILIAVGFAGAGVMHLLQPAVFVRIVPPGLPGPEVLVLLSGLAEIAGGLGLLVPWSRRWAGRGLIVLLLAVFPANVFMAVRAERFADLGFSAWVLWARLPFQLLFIAAVWKVSVRRELPRDVRIEK